MPFQTIVLELEARYNIMQRLREDGREFHQHWQEYKMVYDSIRHELVYIPKHLTDFRYQHDN